MPDMQPAMPAATPVPLAIDVASADADYDFALGCECADPSLQIERWMQEARAAGDPS
jgi:hypothetical protein